MNYILPQRIDDALPQNMADLSLDLWWYTLHRAIQEQGVKRITESKQPKDGGVEVARVLVSLNPSLLSNIFLNLVVINRLVFFFPLWGLGFHGCRTEHSRLSTLQV